MFIHEMFLFQVSLKILVYAVILLYASSSFALPFLRPIFGTPWPVLRPHPSSSASNSRDSDHFWDTRLASRRVNSDSQFAENKVDGPVKTKLRNNVKRPLLTSLAVFGKTSDTPILFPDTISHSRSQYGQKTNAWFDGEGMEQKMLLPRGYRIPEEMYGPNYVWDTKGWPRLITTTPKPVYKQVKNSTNSRLYHDSPIIFKDNPPLSLHFPTTSHSQIKRQNYYPKSSIEENPSSNFESGCIEPRISLRKENNTPKELLQPTRVLDNKGWTRFVATSPTPTRQHFSEV